MLDEQGVLSCEELIGEEVKCLMLTKKFFNKHANTITQVGTESFIERKLNMPVVYAQQEHSNKVLSIDQYSKDPFPCVDGLYTQSSELALGIRTADCLPVILFSLNSREIASVHAGWRGLSQGILENTIQLFESRLDSVISWIAPCISSKNYEVGREVFDKFINQDKNSISSFLPGREENTWYLDLREEAKRRLEKKGIKVLLSDYCTYSDSKLFHSYRRNKTSNRMVTIVWRNK